MHISYALQKQSDNKIDELSLAKVKLEDQLSIEKKKREDLERTLKLVYQMIISLGLS